MIFPVVISLLPIIDWNYRMVRWILYRRSVHWKSYNLLWKSCSSSVSSVIIVLFIEESLNKEVVFICIVQLLVIDFCHAICIYLEKEIVAKSSKLALKADQRFHYSKIYIQKNFLFRKTIYKTFLIIINFQNICKKCRTDVPHYFNKQRDHPFCGYAKYSEKLTFLTPWKEMLVFRKILCTY